jgi:hypothetical protein
VLKTPRERLLLNRMREARKKMKIPQVMSMPDGLTLESLQSWSLNVWQCAHPPHGNAAMRAMLAATRLPSSSLFGGGTTTWVAVGSSAHTPRAP